MVLREFLFFFALALTTYDALQNSPPKVSDVPPALPFFEKGSLVTDWYKGELSKAFTSIAMFDVSFVMYYAPWDAECQHVKHEFDKAAQVMFKQVHFTAINCWNPGGECRLHHNHISVWPIIIAHTNLLKTLIYNGPMDYMSMVKFLQQVMKPLTRLTTSDSLVELVSVCDAVVVGFTPMDNDSLAYNIFYNVALKNLELDPFANVCFGVVTSEKLAVEIGVKTLPHVKLVLWNDTLEYPSIFPFNEENISNWVVTRTYRHAFWVMPSWHKSFKMQGLFAQGPVLILFTPRNHFYDQTPNYDLLREVALEYNNCGNSLIKVMTKLRTIQRHKYIEYERDKSRICKNLESLSSGTMEKSFSSKTYQNEATKNVWLNKTTCKKRSSSKNFQLFSLSEESYLPAGMEVTHEELLGLNGYCLKTEESSCFPEFETSHFFSNYDNFENNVMNKLSVSETTESLETSMLDMVDDPRSSINLQKRFLKELCEKVELAAEISPQTLPILNGNNPKIEGLQCETNSSLSFIAIDSLVNHYFAESLGINITDRKDKTAVVIIDSKHETQYLLEKPLSERSIREFIFNYTMNTIPRNLRSTVGISKHTHYFGSDKKNTTSDQVAKNIDPSSQKKTVCIEELNTSSFQDFISQKNKALLITLCGGGAGSCGGLLSLTLLSVAHSFLELQEHIQVARLDASVNDLPWEFTVSKYPTLMFFPAGKKENSRTYPENQPITVEGVLAFVLSGLETPVKLHAKVLLCNQTMDNYDMKKCLTTVRRSVVDLIGNTLRHWRRTQDSAIKNILMRRLQCLRSVAINLGALNTTKVPKTHTVYKQFSESIQTLSNIWKMTVPTLKRRQNHTLDYENL